MRRDRNSGGGGRTVKVVMADMERLPRAINEVVWRAPHNFDVPRPADVALRGVQIVRAAYIRDLAEVSAIECAATYGKDHPCYERLARAAGWPAEVIAGRKIRRKRT